MFLTIVMLVASIVSIVNGGLHKGVIKSFSEVYYVGEDDKLVEKEGVNDELRMKVIVKGFSFTLIALLLVILQLIFLISALSVDVLIIPTVVMIILFVYGMVKSIVGKKKTNKEAMEFKRKGLVKQLIFLAYVIYIFILIVI